MPTFSPDCLFHALKNQTNKDAVIQKIAQVEAHAYPDDQAATHSSSSIGGIVLHVDTPTHGD
jgi:hypothetical protein